MRACAEPGTPAVPGADAEDVLARHGSLVETSLRQISGAWLASHPCLDADDLRQEGMLALLRAAATWRPEAGATFRTYAARCVDNALAQALRAGDPLPVRLRRDLRLVQAARLTSPAADAAAVAAVTGLSARRVVQVLTACAVAGAGDLDRAGEVRDRLAVGVEEEVLEDWEHRARQAAVRQALLELDERSRRIVLARTAEQPNQDVAAELGISPGRVSQIYAATMVRLAHRVPVLLAEQGLDRLEPVG